MPRLSESILRAMRIADPTPDALLVSRAANGDADAVRAIVERHGPMVLRVCRNLLADEHAAEDVFQAVFLILIRRQWRIGRPERLAAFLFGTARRTALKARTAARRRQRLERRMNRPGTLEPSDELTARELLSALDAELERLPEVHRLPLLLCYWQGLSHLEAARRLGWSAGSVKGRLERGRKQLAARLGKRGLAPSVLLAAAATKTVADELVVKTTSFQIVGTSIPANVLTLATMGSAASSVTAIVAAIMLVGVGIVGWASGFQLPEQPERPAPQAARRPAIFAEPRLDREGVPLPDGALMRFGSSRMRQSFASALAFSPDGRRLASTSNALGDAVRVWDSRTGKLLFQLPALENGFQRLPHFSADGREFRVLSGREKTVLLTFDADSGRELRRVELEPSFQAAAASPFGNTIALGVTGPTSSIRTYDAQTGQEKTRIQLPGKSVFGLALSREGRMVAVADTSDTLRLYHAESGALVTELRQEGDMYIRVEFAADHSFLAAVAVDRDNVDPRASPVGTEIHIWDLRKNSIRHKLRGKHLLSTHDLAISPDGACLASCSQQPDVILWDAATGNEIRRFRLPSGAWKSLFSPDGKSLAAVSLGGTITIWDVESRRVLPASADPTDVVRQLRFSENGRELVGVADGILNWSIDEGRETRRPLLPAFADRGEITLSPDGKIVSIADESVRFLEVESGKLLSEISFDRSRGNGVLFSPDGRRVAMMSADSSLRVHEVSDGKELLRFTQRDGPVQPKAFSPDGRWLASVSSWTEVQPCVVSLWDLKSLKETRRVELPGNLVREMAFSPDSRRIAAQSIRMPPQIKRDERTVFQIWDVATGRELPGWDGKTHFPSLFAYSPDGRTVAFAERGLIQIWEVASRSERHRFTTQTDWYHSLAWSPNGDWLATSGVESPVLVWDVYGRDGLPRNSSVDDLDRAWSSLAEVDAARAFQAMRVHLSLPAPAVMLVRSRLTPVPRAESARLKALVAQLGSPRFAERQCAISELAPLADSARIELRAAKAETKSAEVRQAIQQILDGLDEQTPERLRTTRAVETLERIATPAAVKLLDDFANGAPEAHLTVEATAAMERLNRRYSAGRN